MFVALVVKRRVPAIPGHKPEAGAGIHAAYGSQSQAAFPGNSPQRRVVLRSGGEEEFKVLAALQHPVLRVGIKESGSLGQDV